MKTLAIIPARFCSTRFPGKPLVVVDGKPVIEHLLQNVSNTKLVDRVIVATDDQRIVDAVNQFGGEAVMTSKNHKSGTDRCGEAIQLLSNVINDYDIIVNIQGDNFYAVNDHIRLVTEAFNDPSVQIVTLKKKIVSLAELNSTDNIKVVCDNNGNALYFSRQPIPYLRGIAKEMWLRRQPYYKHVPIYAYRSEALQQIVKSAKTPLEKSESIEQLRWLENGFKIAVRETSQECVAIDLPEDLLEFKSTK